MSSKSIGIVGGAGPLAGVSLLERIVQLCGKLYGCHKDADFPKIHLLSFPFSDMLSAEVDFAQSQKELGDCLKELRDNGSQVLVIACNTLHAFLDTEDDRSDLVHLPREVAKEIPKSGLPLVLCTSTSVKFGVHRKFFPCQYPDFKVQRQIDDLIDRILKGTEQKIILQDLTQILENQAAKTIILGCTELSIFYESLSIPNKLIIDPLEIVAKQVLQKSFSPDHLKKRSIAEKEVART
jgi:aspartate racemase